MKENHCKSQTYHSKIIFIGFLNKYLVIAVGTQAFNSRLKFKGPFTPVAKKDIWCVSCLYYNKNK